MTTKQITIALSAWQTMEQTVRDKAEEIDDLRAALIPFARIWAINEPLQPDLGSAVRDYAAGTWPMMGDAKRAHDLVWQHRKPGE